MMLFTLFVFAVATPSSGANDDALALHTGEPAVVVRVIEPFNETARFQTDDGSALGLPPLGIIELAPADGDGTRADYLVGYNHQFGLGYVQLVPPTREKPFDCSGATHLVLRYRVLAPPSVPHATFLRVALLDSSDSGEPETYMHFAFDVLGNDVDEPRELRIELCGDRSAFSPFWNMGSPGDGRLDLDRIAGFRLEIASDAMLGEKVTTGAIAFERLSCVCEQEHVKRVAAGECSSARGGDGCRRVPNVRLTKGARFRVEYAHQECCALCAADPECLYFMLDLSTKVFEGQPPLCYIGGDALPPDAVVANGENPLLDAHERYEVSVMDSSDKRGLLCTACRCDGATADCRGADLAFVPVADASFSPRRLDLSENPRLQLIDPGAFEGMTDLAMLTLPAAAAHVSPEALRGPALRSVAFAPGDSPARTWVAADSPTDFFQELCCGRADLGVDGVKACDWTPKSPGIDCEYLKNLQIHDVDPLYVVTTDSFFMAEAAESATKCGAVCELADNCHAFTYVDDTESCYLFPSGFRISFAEVEGVSLTSGLSPRARAELRNAVVLAEPSVVELSEGTGYRATIRLALGATPLHGAVWISPRVGATVGLEGVEFRPPRVALYDEESSVSIEVSLSSSEPPTRDVSAPLAFDVLACDAAFVYSDLNFVLSVVTPQENGGHSGRGARRRKQRVILAAEILAAVIGAVILLWLTRSVCRYARKKRQLEDDRALLVSEQVKSAIERVGEFQAHFTVVPGDAFCAMDRLKTHEQLRSEDVLLVYDSVADVSGAMDLGFVFCFLSHQWLGWGEADPHGKHMDAMRRAVQAVARDAGVPLASVRVWCDVVSIPQKNRSEQRLAIASLPTFASCSNYFVAVAPDATHADTRCACGEASYRSRTWCRAEMLSCWSRNGVANMYLAHGDGLQPLMTDDQSLASSLDVFGGELTCCRLGHADGGICDRESLMLPVLGLVSEIYRKRNEDRADAWEFLEPILDDLFPRTFEFVQEEGDGETRTHRVLFGDLVEAAMYAVDAEGRDGAKRRAPDFCPGTRGAADARRRTHHLTSISHATPPHLLPSKSSLRSNGSPKMFRTVSTDLDSIARQRES